MKLQTLNVSRKQIFNDQSGFTLIELLVSMVLGLVVIAASLGIYSSASRGSKVSEIETRMNEEGVLALNIIQQQLKQAGYSQKVIPDVTAGVAANIKSNFSGAAVRGCNGGFTSNTAAFDLLTCTGTGSDSIAVRYEATVNNTIPTSSPALPTNCMGNGIQETTPSSASPAPIPPLPALTSYGLADNRFYVSSTTATPNEKDLYCGGSAGGSVITAGQPIVANVESMQITYGVATNPSFELASKQDALLHQITKYMTAAEVDAITTGDISVNGRWGRVLAVRVCLLMRSTTTVRDSPTGGYIYKDCSNTAQTSTDNYLRRAYTTTVMLRNRIISP
jgi:type IV pilus assembly protein PilW